MRRDPIVRAGAFALVVTLCACGANMTSLSTSGAGSYGAAASPTAGRFLYLASRNDNSVLIFPTMVHGNKAPARRIAGSNTRLRYPMGLAVDADGTIYVANDNGAKQVEIFSADANGNVKPKILGGPSTGLVYVQGLAVDRSGQLYVADYDADAVFVFAKGARGSVAPIRTISGSATTLTEPSGVTFDSAGNLYVANGGSVLKFAKNANGNVVPLATLAGNHTGIGYIVSVCIDPTGRIVVANKGGASVSIFAAGARGNTAPVATISGPQTHLASVTTVGVDWEGRMYVTDFVHAKKSYVRIFANNAKGDSAPDSHVGRIEHLRQRRLLPNVSLALRVAQPALRAEG